MYCETKKYIFCRFGEVHDKIIAFRERPSLLSFERENGKMLNTEI